jgi:hypothetical protein
VRRRERFDSRDDDLDECIERRIQWRLRAVLPAQDESLVAEELQT